jgi:guanylate kinase
MAKGPLIILSGPSGSGKSTVVARLLQESGLPLRVAVAATTRLPRAGEVDGVSYHFWTRARFEEEVRAGAFLEHAEYAGNLYGTLRSEVEPYRERGVGVVLVIDVQGAAKAREQCPDAVTVFLRTSTFDVLERRLRGRGDTDEAAIARRLAAARAELARAGEYRHEVINDHLDEAVARLGELAAASFERGA